MSARDPFKQAWVAASLNGVKREELAPVVNNVRSGLSRISVKKRIEIKKKLDEIRRSINPLNKTLKSQLNAIQSVMNANTNIENEVDPYDVPPLPVVPELGQSIGQTTQSKVPRKRLQVAKEKSVPHKPEEQHKSEELEELEDESEEPEDELEDNPVTQASLKYRYDPEFGKEVADRKQMIMLLKNALKDLEMEERKQQNASIHKHIIPKNLMELLINYVLNKDIDLSTILSLHFDGWNYTRSRTSLFEALWIIVIGLGCLPQFPIENIQLLDWRGVNKKDAPKIITSKLNSSKSDTIYNILEGMPFGTRAGGVSDITFSYRDHLEEKKENDEEGKEYSDSCGKDSCEEKKIINKIFISSVKFFELDLKKSIDKFDIAPLRVAADILKRDNIQYEILLFVKDNIAVSNIVDQARKKYLSNEVYPQNIYGEKHLVSALYYLREKILSNIKIDINTTIQSIYGRDTPPKSYLALRFHQELIVEKTNHYLTTTKDTEKKILIGVLPRGGKTYICGGIVSKLKPNIVLVLTHVPKETHKQFLDDLFHKFEDFSEYRRIYLAEKEVVQEKLSTKMIIFTSYQLLKMGYTQFAENKPISRGILKGLVEKTIIPDMCFLDEAHFGSGGEIAKEVYKTFHPNTIRVLMTATYHKPYYQFEIRPHQLFHWDYEDIQLGKKLKNADDFKKFRERHLLKDELSESNDTIFDRVLHSQSEKGNGIHEIQHIYSKFPDIEFITSSFEEKAKDEFREQLLEDGSKGFSMEAILSINPKQSIPSRLSNAYTLFTNPNIVGKFLNYIRPSDGSYLTALNGEAVPHIDGNVGPHFNIMDRIYQDSDRNGNRLKRNEPHTQIWFIPPSNGIQKRIFALASLLLEHPWFREHFCILGIHGGESDKVSQPSSEIIQQISMTAFIDGKCLNMSCGKDDDLKKCIEDQQRTNRCNLKKGTIILTGFMLRMGISLGCADVVMLFDDDSNPDSTIQKTFRALTESEGKKKAYVVDLNPRRSIKALCQHIEDITYTKSKSSTATYETVVNTFGINSDRFLFPSPGGKPLSYNDILTDIKDNNEQMPISKNLKNLEKSAIDLAGAFDDPDIDSALRQEFMNSYLYGMRMKRLKEQVDSGNSQNINNLGGKGTTRKKLSSSKKSPKKSSDSKNKFMTEEELYKHSKILYETTLKIIAFTYDAKNIEEVYSLLSKDTTIQHLVYDTLLKRELVKEAMLPDHKRDKDGKIVPKLNPAQIIQHNTLNKQHQDGIINDILESLKVVIGKKPNIRYSRMKDLANDKMADQQNILSYIDKHLAPTFEQRKKFGAVFTPMTLVNEMLDCLEKCDPTIFQNKDLKWLDPANGMGNFPVAVFYRLMKNLKNVSKDPQIRAEYIVKNMLYMSELQKENSAKCKRIFKKLAPGVEPNLLTCDTLEDFIVKTNFKDNTHEFDIVMGNPPFQAQQEAEGKRGGGDELYMKFVKKSIEWLKPNGLLLFVHPPSWRKPEYNENGKKSKNAGMFTLMVHENQLLYLEMHDANDGQKVFHAGTRYDFYVLKKHSTTKHTTIKDIRGEVLNIDLQDFDFLPNFNFKNVIKLFPKKSDSICELGTFDEKTKKYTNNSCILYERSAYASDKNWTSTTKDSDFKYPVVHTVNESGTTFYYSSTNKYGMFGIPKVIFAETSSGIAKPIIDIEGKYGMTQGAMGLVIKNEKDANKLKLFLQSNFFKNIVSSCTWGGFRVDWRLFTYFKDHFWEEDVTLNEAIISVKKQKDDNPIDGTKKSKSKKGGAFNKTRKNRRS